MMTKILHKESVAHDTSLTIYGNRVRRQMQDHRIKMKSNAEREHSS